MTWVRRATSDPHTCEPPCYGGYNLTPMGRLGDLWRCDDCGTLWRIDVRDGPANALAIGMEWRAATLWQRLRYRKRGRS